MRISNSKIRLILLSLLLVGLSNCTQISPLSDVPIEDPSLIRAKLYVSKAVNSNGGTAQAIYARLEDKNGDRIELEQGSVSVNGLIMQVSREVNFVPPFIINTNLPYYTISEGRLSVLPDSTYAFKITLADNKEYSATIHTQENDLNALHVPSNHRRTQPLTVKWVVADGRYPIRIYTVRWSKENGQDRIHSASFDVNSGGGEFTFSGNFFTEFPDTYRVDFTVSSRKEGQVDAAFAGGSHISSVFSVSKSVEIQ